MLFRRKAPEAPEGPAGGPPAVSGPGYFPSGIPGLDAILGGGYRSGRLVVVEGGPSVGGEDFLELALPTLAEFLRLGRGALIVPPAGVLPAEIRRRAIARGAESTFETRVRVLDYNRAELREPWVVPMGRYGRAEAMRAVIIAERAVRGTPPQPFLELTGVDTVENALGAEPAIAQLQYRVSRTKEAGDLGLFWERSGSPASPAVAGLSDYHFALARSAGTLELRGIRPEFPARAIAVTEVGGVPRATLGLPLGTGESPRTGAP